MALYSIHTCGINLEESVPAFNLIRTMKNMSLLPKRPPCPCRKANTDTNSVSTPVSSITSLAAAAGISSPASTRPNANVYKNIRMIWSRVVCHRTSHQRFICCTHRASVPPCQALSTALSRTQNSHGKVCEGSFNVAVSTIDLLALHTVVRE